MAEVKETKSVRQAQDREQNTEMVVAKVVRTVLSNSRHATAKTKKRGEVSGGGKKPWKQKGTGRARVGSSRSPIWRGGGIVFGPTGVQNFDLKANKKERAIAKEAAFKAKKSVTKEFAMPKLAKTKEAAEFLKKNNLTGTILVLIDQKPETGKPQTEGVTSLKRAFANIPNVSVKYVCEANAYEVLKSDAVAILGVKAETKKASEA